MTNTQILEKALDRLGVVSKELIDECQNENDAIAVAVALVVKAQTIYTTIGGRKHAAAQFYAVADRLAADPAPTPSSEPV